jgi:hypothetical protein
LASPTQHLGVQKPVPPEQSQKLFVAQTLPAGQSDCLLQVCVPEQKKSAAQVFAVTTLPLLSYVSQQ